MLLSFAHLPRLIPRLLVRIVFAVFFVVNLFLWGAHSSAAIPFTTLLALLGLWFGISLPLTFVGSFLGFRRPVSTLCKFYHLVTDLLCVLTCACVIVVCRLQNLQYAPTKFLVRYQIRVGYPTLCLAPSWEGSCLLVASSFNCSLYSTAFGKSHLNLY